ncbi:MULTISPECIES: VOC family protein [unclassified Rhodococcus (in: high G+C Gram-positive bacteria)]|nr:MULTISPECIES: VOC family protein [unclassified Rhodococcus (in: high G+C Gram-positive bacteria)]
MYSTVDHAVGRAVVLGASVFGDRHSDAAGSFQVLLDPEGNEWCLVTPPG